MNKLQKILNNKQHPLLSIYFTAGYPKLNDTQRILEYLSKSSVDFVEVGFPFSDPIADGPVIQKCNQIAIKNGMSLKLLFEQLSQSNFTDIPIVLMGYLNPILQMGIQKFLDNCLQNQIQGLIIPDLPFDFYEKYFEKTMIDYEIASIFLVTPSTNKNRMHWIQEHTTGFVYVVSDHSITGKEIDWHQRMEYFQNIQENLKDIPKMIGFGIKDKKSYEFACKYADGAIIGSEFLRFLEKNELNLTNIKNFVQSIKS